MINYFETIRCVIFPDISNADLFFYTLLKSRLRDEYCKFKGTNECYYVLNSDGKTWVRMHSTDGILGKSFESGILIELLYTPDHNVFNLYNTSNLSIIDCILDAAMME